MRSFSTRTTSDITTIRGSVRSSATATFTAIFEAIRKAKSVDTEKLIAALRGLQWSTPFGPAQFRAADHQSTMGAYVGKLDVRDGKGVMVDWRYADGAKYLPSPSRSSEAAPARSAKIA